MKSPAKILGFGLGGNSTTMLVGWIFNLGPVQIDVEVEPPSGGGGGGGGAIAFPPSSQPSPQPMRPYFPNNVQTVTVTIKYKNHTWVKVYKWRRKLAFALVKVLETMTTITTNISVVINKVKRVANKIKIKGITIK